MPNNPCEEVDIRLRHAIVVIKLILRIANRRLEMCLVLQIGMSEIWTCSPREMSDLGCSMTSPFDFGACDEWLGESLDGGEVGCERGMVEDGIDTRLDVGFVDSPVVSAQGSTDWFLEIFVVGADRGCVEC